MSEPLRPQPPQKPDRSSLAPVVLALLAAVAISIVLFFLTGGFFAVVIVIGGLIGLITAFHYIVWGWWLGRMIEREEQETPPGDESS